MDRFVPLAQRSYLALLTELARGRVTGTAVLRDRDGDRHGVTFDAGYVRAVHMAGRFDPLLAVLERRGLLSRAARSRCLGALCDGASSGELATSLAHVPPPALRDALRAQLVERFAALLAWADERGFDARLEPAEHVCAQAGSLRIPLGALLRALGLPVPGAAVTAQTASAELARRALRRVAARLHPDRHPELTPAERALLERELAEATARYHGFHRVA